MATFYVDSAAAGGGDGSLATPWNATSSITGLVAGDVLNIEGAFSAAFTPTFAGSAGNPIIVEADGATWTRSGDILVLGASGGDHVTYRGAQLLAGGSNVQAIDWSGRDYAGLTFEDMVLDTLAGDGRQTVVLTGNIVTSDITFRRVQFNVGGDATAGGRGVMQLMDTTGKAPSPRWTIEDCDFVGGGRTNADTNELLYLLRNTGHGDSGGWPQLKIVDSRFSNGWSAILVAVRYIGTGVRQLLNPDLMILRNDISAVGETTTTTTKGGIQVTGMLRGKIAYNRLVDIKGDVGGINVADGDGYEVSDNWIEDTACKSDDFDGGGILCAGSDFRVLRNRLKDCRGRDDGASNNGFDLRFGNTEFNGAAFFVGNLGTGGVSGMHFNMGTEAGESIGLAAQNTHVLATPAYAGLVYMATHDSGTGRNRNSIYVGVNSGDTAKIVEVGSTGGSDEDYNCFYNFASTGASLGANSITVDPGFVSATDCRLDTDSSCVGTGINWWDAIDEECPQGEDGLRFYDPPSMGAYELRPDKSGYARSAGALSMRILLIGVDIVKARSL